MTATMSPLAYWSSVVLATVGCIALCIEARRRPGRWTVFVASAIGVALATDASTYMVGLIVAGEWSPKTSLPLALCNAMVVVAALACWSRVALLVELTYFLGLAGTLQAVITPDLNVGFPHLEFLEYMVGHLGVVFAALFLVVGMGLYPRAWSVVRVFAITALYTTLVGLIDGTTGANYMFLRSPPGEWTVLRLLGPWPWYVVSAAGVGLALLVLLDLPFWGRRRNALGAVGRPIGAHGPARLPLRDERAE